MGLGFIRFSSIPCCLVGVSDGKHELRFNTNVKITNRDDGSSLQFPELGQFNPFLLQFTAQLCGLLDGSLLKSMETRF